MDCPKCNSKMKEIKVETLHGPVVVDQCGSCKGLWFDIGEAEQLKKDWMADFLDSGDPDIGKTYNAVRDIDCPRCQKPMKKINDAKQKHLEIEACQEHGMFMDAGEFTDYKHETLLDIFRGLISSVKRRR
ncbi:MAG: zf-TFIIB domain-containing protein [Pseudohongiellaceae bacterium]